MKARASFTINSSVLAKLDTVVDNITYRSKSEAVEDILRKFFERQNTAIILCSGDFSFDSSGVYRPFLKIGNYTVIENIVNNLRVNGFRNIYVSGGTDLLKNIFKLMKNGEGYGVDIKYLDDNNTNGSAKAMERAKQFVGSTTLFVPGDCVMDIDLKDMLRFHIANNGVASIAISSSEKSIPSSNDSILLKGNKVVCYGCNGQQGTHKLVATSVLIVEKDVFKYIPPGDMKWEINSDLLPLLANEGELFGYVYHGAWVSIKTREELEKAKSMLPLK